MMEKTNHNESAGFFKDGLIFEQVKNGKYIIGKNLYEANFYEIDDVTYVPLTKQPWLLASEATSFEGLNDLRKEIKEFLIEHLFLSEPALYEILTSWIIATWISEVWVSVPYLFFFGPIGSGKTRALELLQHLSYRAMISSNISSAALYRAIEELRPTLLLDETEILGKVKSKAETFGLLNSGYRKGQTAIRVRNTQNGSYLDFFDVFGFKAFAGTYGLNRATESRSIIVNTLKAGKIKVRRTIDEKRAEKIRNMLLGYRFDILAGVDVSAVSDVFLDIGDCLDFANGRLLELFTPMVAVAGEDKEDIIEYLKKLAEKKDSEELAGEEAEIIQILIQKGIIDGNNFVTTNKLTILFNMNRNEDEQIGNKRMGWLMRKLGFSPKRLDGQRGWIIQPDRLKKHKENYNLETTEIRYDTSNKTEETTKTARNDSNASLPSYEHQSQSNVTACKQSGIMTTSDNTSVQSESKNDFFGYRNDGEHIICSLCNKPISNIKDMMTYNIGPCHTSCKIKSDSKA